jgi:hypothetical protein
MPGFWKMGFLVGEEREAKTVPEAQIDGPTGEGQRDGHSGGIVVRTRRPWCAVVVGSDDHDLRHGVRPRVPLMCATETTRAGEPLCFISVAP